MLMTGKEYLQSIRDGRVIYVGKERIEDQTTHPAFAGAARTYAALFDLKSDPALRDGLQRAAPELAHLPIDLIPKLGAPLGIFCRGAAWHTDRFADLTIPCQVPDRSEHGWMTWDEAMQSCWKPPGAASAMCGP